MTAPPFIAGKQAAQDGKPFDANPHPKPDRPEQGDAYPGDWANWAAGWCNQHSIMGQEQRDARKVLDAFMLKGLW